MILIRARDSAGSPLSAGSPSSPSSACAASSARIRRPGASSRSRAAGSTFWSLARPMRLRSCCCMARAAISTTCAVALGDRLARRYRVILVDRPGARLERSAGRPRRCLARPSGGADPSGARADRRHARDRASDIRGPARSRPPTRWPIPTPSPASCCSRRSRIPWHGGVGWYNPILATRVVGPLFARTLTLPLGKLLIGPGVSDASSRRNSRRPAIATARRSDLVLRPTGVDWPTPKDLAQLEGVRRRPGPDVSRAIQAPIVVITGDVDDRAREFMRSRLPLCCPESKLVVLPGVGPHAASRRARQRGRGRSTKSLGRRLPALDRSDF